jgi:hypothetical protein
MTKIIGSTVPLYHSSVSVRRKRFDAGKSVLKDVMNTVASVRQAVLLPAC